MAAFARHKTVPAHAQSFWYYWGGISLFLFIVQCFTGILLLVYYRPGADAYESVRQITFVMHFGWLIRSAHSWSANLMLFAIFVHMFSVFFMKAYRKPREFGWLSGMALLALATVFGFSGYLLPMDELSYFATKVGLQIPAAIPFIGPAIASMLRGALTSANSRCSVSSRCMWWFFPRFFCHSLASTCGSSSGTATRFHPAKKPGPQSSARASHSCRASFARTWPCGLSRSTFLPCWPLYFRGRWADRPTPSRQPL
jgi:quinol-cytochrome oxidoreductase complex cytochrome b subunit